MEDRVLVKVFLMSFIDILFVLILMMLWKSEFLLGKLSVMLMSVFFILVVFFFYLLDVSWKKSVFCSFSFELCFILVYFVFSFVLVR